jgi:hypothetical protein
VSKILSAPRDELVLPPLGRLPIRLEVLPQKGNPDYRKQITVHNLLNRADDATIEVTANNVDPVRRTLWHRRPPPPPPPPHTHTHTHTNTHTLPRCTRTPPFGSFSSSCCCNSYDGGSVVRRSP